MTNYVKFRRGTPDAFKALGDRVEQDTLYFIYNESEDTADLYLGSKLISSGENDSNSLANLVLNDLVDVSIGDPVAGNVLIYNETDECWENRSMEEVLEDYGSTVSVTADNVSIENVAGKLQLKDFGTGYYAYIPAEKDEETGEIVTPSTYEYTEGFKSGLELRVVTTAEGELSLAWYEPGTETVEDVAANIEAISKDVDALDKTLNAEGGIKDQVKDLQTNLETTNDTVSELSDKVDTKADADTVYTKTEIDETLANIYTKTETDTAISEAIVAADHLKRVKVDSVGSIDETAEDAEQYIYMVPTGLTEDDDKYDEYMVIDGIIEKVGSWEIDLKDYATIKYVDEELATKVDAEEGKRLITEAEANKLINLLTINSVSSDFTISETHELNLTDLSVQKITDLEEWLNTNAGSQKGLSENNLSNDLYNKLNSSLYIKSVNTNQLRVDDDGLLSVLGIDINQVSGLENALKSKATTESVTDLEDYLNSHIEQTNAKLNDIETRLTWQSISE